MKYGVKRMGKGTKIEKIYYNHKNNTLCIQYIDYRIDVDYGIGDTMCVLEKKCPEKDIDIYVGVALMLARLSFGSNSRFRRFVDNFFYGKKPEDYIKEQETPVQDSRTLEEAMDEEQKYKVGERVLFTPDDNSREVIGEVLDYDFETQTYTIKWNDRPFRILPIRIIRKCRKPNKKPSKKEEE